MGKLSHCHPVKLIAGFIFNDDRAFDKAVDLLKKHFGSIDFESQALPFDFSDYYEKEFGKNLKRKFVSFKKLILPDKLAGIKLLTNKTEEKLSSKHCRRVNIDPGYLDCAKLVLATTKDFSHRIYLKSGIFAEVTLCYKDKAFKSWDWTYPDYRTPEYAAIFNQIRELYVQQIQPKSR